MKNGKVTKIRTNPANQPGVQLTEPGVSPKPGDQRVKRRVWRVGHPSLSICSASQAKPRACPHPSTQRSIYGQVGSRLNRADKKFFSGQGYFYQRVSQPGTERFSKTKRGWTRKRTTRRLNLSSSLTACGLKSCLWFIAFWFPYWPKKKPFQGFK